MSSGIQALIDRALRPVRTRLTLLVGRAVLRAVADGPRMQVVQLTALDGETLDGVERWQDYGFTSHPRPGAEAVVLSLCGNRDHAVAIRVDDRRYRLTGLAEGEVALYDDLGQRVHLTRTGIEIDSPLNIYARTDGVLRLEGEGVEIHGRTYVQQDVAGKGWRETHVGGTAYRTDTWTTGAIAVPGTEFGLDQPHIPSDHPEGP